MVDNKKTFRQLVVKNKKRLLVPLNPKYETIEIIGQDVTVVGVVRQMGRDAQFLRRPRQDAINALSFELVDYQALPGNRRGFCISGNN